MTGEDGTFTVKKAKAGDYVLHETEAPENHGLAEDVNFTLTNKQILLNEEAVAEIVVEDPRLKADLIIRKVDAETEEPLAGAEFTIKSGDLYLQTDGTLLETPYTFTSGEDGYIKVSDVFAGEFILHEEKAPELYETIEDVSFTIRGEDIVLNGTTVKEIVVKDPRILGDILIRKVDEETKDVLAGAEFTIKSGDQYLQADGSLAEKEYTFTTDANGEIKVSKVHDGSYTLHETKAPKGYDLAKDVTFEVKDTKMMIDGKAVEVIMVNDPRIILADILIRKVDEKTKEVLSGAIFTIREANGLFLQPDGTLSEVVATFTTDAEGEIRVSSVTDGIYTLHESKAPEGYDLAEDITFTVKDAKMLVNGGIVEVIMVNDPKIEIPPKPPVPPTAAR